MDENALLPLPDRERCASVGMSWAYAHGVGSVPATLEAGNDVQSSLFGLQSGQHRSSFLTPLPLASPQSCSHSEAGCFFVRSFGT